MPKPPSRFKVFIRETQLMLSLGVLAVVLHALITSTLALHWTPPTATNAVELFALRGLVLRGDLLLLAPLLCAGAVMVFSIRPLSATLGVIGIVEVTGIFMHWTQGGFDEDAPPSAVLAYFAPYWLVSAMAAGLSFYAGRRMEARAKANPVPARAAPGSSPAAASDFAEQMRAAQERARDPGAAAAVTEAPAPETGAKPPPGGSSA